MNDTNQTDLLYTITGKIFSHPYDWGGNKLIPDTLGFPPEPNTPYAEYWIGAHKRAPSMVAVPDGEVPLEELITKNPEGTLGTYVAEHYGELPYLFKLAEATKMLSVQVHPNKEQAQHGFAEEEKSAIPATDLQRTFKDPNAKTEMPLALSDFWLLHGLRSVEEINALFQETNEFAPLQSVFNNGDYKKLYSHVLQDMTDAEVNTMLGALDARITPRFEAGELTKTSPDYWAAKAIKDFNLHGNTYDRGLFSIYFTNIVLLKPGQALLQNEGIIHAFLEGQYIEIMQNSDNIARAGMTNKPIDITGLMQFMHFNAHTPQIVDGTPNGNETFYNTSAEEFLVSKISLGGIDAYQSRSYSVEILIGMAGDSRISANGKTLPLGKGKSVVVFAHCDYEITGSEDGVIYKTSIPQKEGM